MIFVEVPWDVVNPLLTYCRQHKCKTYQERLSLYVLRAYLSELVGRTWYHSEVLPNPSEPYRWYLACETEEEAVELKLSDFLKLRELIETL